MTMGDDRAVAEDLCGGARGEDGGMRAVRLGCPRTATSRVGEEAGSRGWAQFCGQSADAGAETDRGKVPSAWRGVSNAATRRLNWGFRNTLVPPATQDIGEVDGRCSDW